MSKNGEHDKGPEKAVEKNLQEDLRDDSPVGIATENFYSGA